jgi:hypothetical protein
VLQLTVGDREQAFGAERDAFVEAELLLEAIAPEPERTLAARGELAIELINEAADCGARLG